ncbi:peptidylprolyl isomerase [Gammaproteobacteria bacterium]|nr:peptidylprolyl isomerase [Gammaproteobacteria bacterium]
MSSLANADPVVRFETTMGNFDIDLYAEDAPKTVENFVQYVSDGHFDGLIFHRVIPGFVAQGGGMEPGMKQRETREPIGNEADNGRKNKRGTLSMARTQDPHSATSQFFINFVDNVPLDHTAKTTSGWGYAVFGEIADGMDVIDQMAKQATGSSGFHRDVPKEDIVVTRAYVVE